MSVFGGKMICSKMKLLSKQLHTNMTVFPDRTISTTAACVSQCYYKTPEINLTIRRLCDSETIHSDEEKSSKV